MNGKIQEIIRAQAAHITSDFVNDPGRTAQEFRQQAEAHILRAFLEVIREAGVEGALQEARDEVFNEWANWYKANPDAPRQGLSIEAKSLEWVAKQDAALRTLKELHQSAPVRPEDSNVTTN